MNGSQLTNDPPFGGRKNPPLFQGDSARMAHFSVLDREQQAAALRRLAALGWTEHGIAHATQLAVEQVCRILAERT